jgi:ABC-type nitrate/sulfonate/bicarbonate transport system substrate-binding protein
LFSGKEKKILKSSLIQLVVALDWTPNTNHTGLYVAQNEKYFQQQGLNVKFVQPNQTTATALVASGTAQFGVSFTGDVINAQSSGLKVKSIAAILPSNTSCFAWRESAGIKGLKDLEGKRYGGWGSPEEISAIKYLSEKNGVNFSKIKIVTTGVSDFLLTTKKNADFMWIFMGWDGIRAKLAGVKIQTLCPKDIDSAFDTASPLLIASQKMLSQNPIQVQKFLQATSDGYIYASKKPSESAKILLKQVPELDPALVEESAKYLAPLYLSEGSWGLQNKVKWEKYVGYVSSQKLVQKIFPAENYFTNDFLPPKLNSK